MKFKLNDIISATKGRLASGDAAIECTGISIDTRKVGAGELFVAIKGAHFDGHEFIEKAVQSGARAVLVKKGFKSSKNINTIEVEDTERALGDVAGWWRTRFNIPCVAITGSNGKSTTKEMTAAALGTFGKVLKTEGNFNNLIGLPLTVFRWEDSCRVAILEMGMNAAGEIKRLTEIAKPTVGLITNVTAAHLEKLHTVEAVARAKGELFEAMPVDAVAVVNGEDKFVREMGRAFKGKKIFFGMQNDFDVKFLHMEMKGLESMDVKIAVMGREFELKLGVPGSHNVMNAMAAISVGCALGIDPREAIARIEDFKPMEMRMERIQLANGVRVVNDSYNANPGSMKAAFRTVGAAKRAGRFIAVLGDMLELGGASKKLHKDIGGEAARLGVERIFVTGEFANDVADGATGAGLKSSSITIVPQGSGVIGEMVEKEFKAGDVLLVKGSRGMKMEKVVEYLKNSIGVD